MHSTNCPVLYMYSLCLIESAISAQCRRDPVIVRSVGFINQKCPLISALSKIESGETSLEVRYPEPGRRKVRYHDQIWYRTLLSQHLSMSRLMNLMVLIEIFSTLLIIIIIPDHKCDMWKRKGCKTASVLLRSASAYSITSVKYLRLVIESCSYEADGHSRVVGTRSRSSSMRRRSGRM